MNNLDTGYLSCIEVPTFRQMYVHRRDVVLAKDGVRGHRGKKAGDGSGGGNKSRQII